MFCGVVHDDLMVRVGPDRCEEALAKPHVRPMDFTGRPMRGYVFVERDACRTRTQLEDWVSQGAEFVSSIGPE